MTKDHRHENGMMARRTALGSLGGVAIGFSAVFAGKAHGATRAPEVTARQQVARLRRHLASLNEIARTHGGNRAAGSAGYEASARYVENALKRTAFVVERQYFSYETLVEVRNTVQQVSPRRDIVSAPATGVSSSPAGGHTGGLVVPEDEFGDADDSWAGRAVAGKIALLRLRPPTPARVRPEPSGCHGRREHAERRVLDPDDMIRRQLSLAGAAGIAAVVFDSGFELPIGILFSDPSDRELVPATCTTEKEASYLRDEMSAKTVEMHVDLEVEKRKIETFNLLAEMPGKKSTHICGAHLDSVRKGPGMSDNGSGSAVLLETVLKQSTNRESPWKFCWWGGEEDGMKGSHHFVAGILESPEFDRLRGYFNLDMVASPNYIISVYGDGLEKLYTDHFQSVGQPWKTGPIDSFSDQIPFLEAGVPVAGLDTVGGAVARLKSKEEEALFGGKAGEPYDPHYHGAGDDLSNISWEALAICAAASDAACRAVAGGRGPKRQP